MTKKSFLVKERPLSAVLSRYGIGSRDKYGRGVWLSARDLPAIEEAMGNDPSKIVVQGTTFVPGSSMHNHVRMKDFKELFAE